MRLNVPHSARIAAARGGRGEQGEAAMARTGNRRAAWLLVVLAPLIAELAFGSTPMHLAYLILLWLPIYGAGILLVREAVRRSGRGWPSIVLLGVAYELVEDGFGLQALSSPNLYHAAGWAPRIFGLNLAYWEVNVIYHVIFSAVIPILLVDLLFPAHREVPYLKKTGLVITGIVALIGVGLLRVSVPPSQDPGYVAPLAVFIGCLILVVALAIIALKVLPRRGQPVRSAASVPPVWALAGLGLVGVLVILGLLFPFGGAKQPAFTHGAWAFLPMGIAAVLVAGLVVLVRRWATSTAWTDEHSLILAGGALLGHTVFGMATVHTTFDRLGLVGVAILTVLLVLWMRRLLRTREELPV
ncbi:hypothetical protein GCM10009765_21530 [Fodinicola feengrottensis]|uniref:DUF998 domain-containing protein n=1 Tax=Fodinicola feengrottensis TaxID=435914 RepID=A0ABN2GIH8_9ACTN